MSSIKKIKGFKGFTASKPEEVDNFCTVSTALCYIYKNITSKKLTHFLKIYYRPLFQGH